MAISEVICLCLFRFVLPIALLTAVIFRYNVFSFVYLVLLLVGPLLPRPSSNVITSGHTGRYIKSVIGVSAFFCIAQVIFQIVLLSLGSYGSFINYCAWDGQLYELIGLNRLDKIKVLNAIRLMGLDFLVFFIAVAVSVTCEKLQEPVISCETQDQTDVARPLIRRKKRSSGFLLFVGEILILIFMAGAGILYASLMSCVYFLSFLVICTCVACNLKLRKKYALGKIPLLIYCAVHFILLYVYQFDFAQQLFPDDNMYERLLGMTRLVYSNCTQARVLNFHQLHWSVYISPFFILGLYFLLATVMRYRLITPIIEEVHRVENAVLRGDSQRSTSSLLRRRKRNRAASQDDVRQDDEQTLLLEGSRRERSYRATENAAPNATLDVDPNGSVIWSSESDARRTSIVPDEITTVTSLATNSKYHKLLSPLIFIFRLLVKGSYVVTLVIMMTWSITYHSWLTFVLLLWSCAIWMMPNSRRACLYSSPALVIYAEALLLLQYIYSFNLNENELPSKIENVNLAQIGLVKYYRLSYQPLAIKILYTIMFWITLHQHIEEKRERNESPLSDGVVLEPFNISYSTSQPGAPKPEMQRQLSTASIGTAPNQCITYIQETIKQLMTKFWIWVVACMLMVISLGGTDVVIYRIVYMFLFVFFILMFQFSYRVWRRVTYGFWLTVIVYSMLVLILIYTYQFQHFPDYWNDYLHVSPKLQRDIGLELYESDPWTLFLKLLTPTFFLIITIIQLHYFHKEFLLISNLDYRPVNTEVLDQTAQTNTPNPNNCIDNTATQIAIEDGPTMESTPVSEVPTVIASELSSPFAKKELPASTRKKSQVNEPAKGELWKDVVVIMKKILKIALSVYEFAWRFLEIHMIKIVLFSVVCLATYDVCAAHLLFIIFAVLALPFKRIQTFLSHCCAVWASVLFLSKMIYQLKSIDQYGWYTNCSASIVNSTNEHKGQPIDNMVWIGFQKTNDLPDYCKGYIGLLFVLTFQAVVKIRQKVARYQANEPDPKPGIIFPNIKREHADDGIIHCIKYMFNYFFYKFGIEFCFVTTVACIGVRLDVYAVISALWLCCLFLLHRSMLAKIWPFYVAYICLTLPLQYMLCVGIPPGFCIDYPWSNTEDPELIEWLFLPSFRLPPNAYKILVDFIQLLFACCQLYVFAIETSPESATYEGGTNEEIIYPKDGELVVNPVSDFVTHTKSYLDMIKVVVFFSSYWITLAVVFLAGTIRVSLFAMGYVIGCFFFLWNGNEFYLQPLHKLLRMWNALLMYNVLVILFKSVLQVVGCVYMSRMYLNFCWVVQLFGIACVKKLKSNDSDVHQNIPDHQCQVPFDEAGLLWDGICFGFLLLQKRLFGSYYFQHLVNEIRAQQILASRGAELIHEIQMKEVQEQDIAEKEIMEKIKAKMDRIRAHQKKGKDGELEEPATHFRAIRSGDYDMFEEYSDDEIDLELSGKTKVEPDDDETAEVKQRGLNALISQTIKSNLKYKMEDVKKGSEEVDDVGDSSQLSPIVSVDRSPVSRTLSGSSRQPGLEQSSQSPHDTTVPTTSSFSHRPSLPATGTLDITPDEEKGTICLEEDKELSDVEEEPPEEDFQAKIKRWLKFLAAFAESVLISATAKLNAISKDYRFVARQLSIEKKKLKEKFEEGCGSDDGNYTNGDTPRTTEPLSSKESKLEVKIKLQKGSQDLAKSVELLDVCDALDKEFEKSHPIYVRFLVACYYAAVSRSEILCYIIIIVNQISSASILSLPLPLMAFLWGTLSVPRPTKTFWITIITYTEALVVVKYLFQFNFFPWNNDSRIGPFFPPRILGIEKNDYYAVYDLILLLVVFFHRFMLKSLGLWKDSDRSTTDIDTPDKTIDDSEDTLVVGLPEEELLRDDVEKSRNEVEIDEEEVALCIKETSDEETKDSGCEADIKQERFFDGMFRYFEPFKAFFCNLLFPAYRVTVDVYAYMFFCDFINFLIVVFGYWAFGTGGVDGGVTSYFQENKVPVPFLIMLLAQFALIVVDRALYLRKHILGKLIFQIILVFIVHLWMFFVLPAVTDRNFTSSSNRPPKLWYFIKCIYLLLSAYQIRSGYPTRILGNFFCKKYNYINLFLFKGYMIVPFLYELRSMMDWIWTDTSMNISNWLKMEDIFSHIFVLKCQRRAEEEYPTPRGAKRSPIIKYGVGGSLLLIIILIIWFPLLLFALGNTVGQTNLPYDCSVEMSISGYEPMFKVSAQRETLKSLSKAQWESLVYHFRAQPNIQSFLANYDKDDVTLVELNSNSTSLWTITPPSQRELINELIGNNTLKMKISWSFSRIVGDSGDVDKSVGNEYEINLSDKTLKKAIASMLNGTKEADPIVIKRIFPKYVRVPGRGKVMPVTVFENVDPEGTNLTVDEKLYPRDLSINLRTVLFGNLTLATEWWEVNENCSKNNQYPYGYMRIEDCKYLRLLAFNDKVFPSELSVLSKYGIVGLYTTFVLVVSRLFRSFVAGSSFTIMFDDMPYVDRVLQLCLDIYLVRESGEFSLEEDLFAKLLFLYRSPETLIKWTRFPEQQ